MDHLKLSEEKVDSAQDSPEMIEEMWAEFEGNAEMMRDTRNNFAQGHWDLDEEYNQVTFLVGGYEKDYSGRDALSIFVQLELLELIQTPKVEAVIKRIYNSDYDQSGNLFQMSTPYQILFCDKNQIEDVENDHRFYKQRNMSDVP